MKISKNHWCNGKIAYQIYPRSFNKSKPREKEILDGNLKGIIKKLDHLKELGVDIVWISPFYKSPDKDNGYDISDYTQIDEKFGDMKDFDKLVAEMKKRGMRIVLDMVLNHTSDQHEWFKQSKLAQNKKKNLDDEYYIWADPKYDENDNRLPPNNWESWFGGSAWEYVPERGQYYLHIFAREQPDLNWRNPKVKQKMFETMRYWRSKGVDGFRLDQAGTIVKERDEDGNYPYDFSEKKEGCIYGEQFFRNKDGVHKILQDMNDALNFEILIDENGKPVIGEDGNFQYVPEKDEQGNIITDKDGDIVYRPLKDNKGNVLDEAFIVGEMAALTHDQAEAYFRGKKEIDVAFQFEIHDKYPFLSDEWTDPLFNGNEDNEGFKKIISNWQKALGDHCGDFLANHDHPRAVSRFGDDVNFREESAKMLAVQLFTLKGTPFIFQGEEFGLKSADRKALNELRDIPVLENGKEQEFLEKIQLFIGNYIKTCDDVDTRQHLELVYLENKFLFKLWKICEEAESLSDVEFPIYSDKLKEGFIKQVNNDVSFTRSEKEKSKLFIYDYLHRKPLNGYIYKEVIREDSKDDVYYGSKEFVCEDSLAFRNNILLNLENQKKDVFYRITRNRALVRNKIAWDTLISPERPSFMKRVFLKLKKLFCFAQKEQTQTDQIAKRVHDFYKKMITLRKNDSILKDGDFEMISPEVTQIGEQPNRIFTYLRKLGDKTKLVMLNYSGEPTKFKLSKIQGTAKLQLSTYEYEEKDLKGSESCVANCEFTLKPFGARVYDLEGLTAKGNVASKQIIQGGDIMLSKELKFALEAGNIERVKSILNEDSNQLMDVDNYGNTALHISVNSYREEMIKYLVSIGIGLDIQNNSGTTPLMIAAEQFPYNNNISLLISNGANLSLRNSYGQSARDIIVAKMNLPSTLQYYVPSQHYSCDPVYFQGYSTSDEEFSQAKDDSEARVFKEYEKILGYFDNQKDVMISYIKELVNKALSKNLNSENVKIKIRNILKRAEMGESVEGFENDLRERLKKDLAFLYDVNFERDTSKYFNNNSYQLTSSVTNQPVLLV